MPLVTTTEMFKKAYDGGYAIGAFNVNNMEIIQGITEAAAELQAPLILQVSKGARTYANRTYLKKLVEAAVIETGMNHFGEIRYLGQMVRPDAAVITNVGDAHIENLGGTRQGLLQAAFAGAHHLAPGGQRHRGQHAHQQNRHRNDADAHDLQPQFPNHFASSR